MTPSTGERAFRNNTSSCLQAVFVGFFLTFSWFRSCWYFRFPWLVVVLPQAAAVAAAVACFDESFKHASFALAENSNYFFRVFLVTMHCRSVNRKQRQERGND